MIYRYDLECQADGKKFICRRSGGKRTLAHLQRQELSERCSQLIPCVLILSVVDINTRRAYRDKKHEKKRCSLFQLDNGAQNSSKAISIVFYTIRVLQLFLSFVGGINGPRRSVACNTDGIREFVIYSATFTAFVLSSYGPVNLHYSDLFACFLAFLFSSHVLTENLKFSL